MAADIDIRFLGELIACVQSDLRGVKADVAQLRAEQLRLEADQAQLKIELFDRIDSFQRSVDARFDNFERSVDAQFGNFERSVDVQFARTHQTMATNLDVVLKAIEGVKP